MHRDSFKNSIEKQNNNNLNLNMDDDKDSLLGGSPNPFESPI